MSYKYWRGFASGMRNTFVNINGEERIITNTGGGFRVDDGLFQFMWEHICLMYVNRTLRRLQTSMPGRNLSCVCPQAKRMALAVPGDASNQNFAWYLLTSIGNV